MSDLVTQQAEKYLRDIQRDFAFAFRGLSRDQIPTLTLRFSNVPLGMASSADKDCVVSRQVFEAFADLLVRQALPTSDRRRILRVNSFENRNFPWFDISIEGSEDTFLFRVCHVHPISQLSSSV